jgi:hypothetical protein
MTESRYSLASFRYDLSKLRAKGLVERIPHSRLYRLVGKGYSICVAFLTLFKKVSAPLTAGLLAPFRGDSALTKEKRRTLDRLYQQICDEPGCALRSRWSQDRRLSTRKREQNSRWRPYNGN